MIIQRVVPMLAVVSAFGWSAACSSPEPGGTDESSAFIRFLDANSDRVIDPYEALDALLQLRDALPDESDGTLEIHALIDLVENTEAEGRAEAAKYMEAWDTNSDGVVQLSELSEDTRGFVALFDANGDGELVISELGSLDDAFFRTDSEVEQEVEELFDELDKDSNLFIDRDEANLADEETWEELSLSDFGRDGRVSKREQLRWAKAHATPMSFHVSGGIAVMEGIISTSTPARVLELILEHPNVHTIEMTIVPGSIDDEANLRAALFVRQHGLKTRIGSEGMIASGGTDFFLAGAQRDVEAGAHIGIHSWGGGDLGGDKIPRDAPEHQPYLQYYRAIGITDAFYWRTLEAAPPEGIHWMTEAEINEYEVRTE